MSHDQHTHDHHAAAMPFTAEEVADLHRQDLGAGASVVTLMTSIFLGGVVLYAVVAYITGSYPA